MVSNISIILVSPKYSRNVGAIVRLMANFEIKELILVDPRVDLKEDEFKSLSRDAIKYINLRTFDTLKEAVSNFSLIFGTSSMRGRKKLKAEPLCNLKNYLKILPSSSKIGLLFGPEDRGLSTKELLFANKIFKIPTSSKYPTLNLSHAVAITLYELNLHEIKKNKAKKATKREMEGFFQHLKEVLLEICFLQENNPERIMVDLKSIFQRAFLDKREVKILRGILRQILTYPIILEKRKEGGI